MPSDSGRLAVVGESGQPMGVLRRSRIRLASA